ncbi:SNF2-related protein [Candidatus Thiothrix sp. Deng01]|uniref:SNF2-related protein n=1 Tax=Candidatus Thiothrix phosphatis TaxID=3112415 RepID=A0ABU6D2B8_9GAMM|nr:SNF2-related protein [Candidatus Thiothrix sp. Deng01]MEB4593229.1 SNF2-related protein [Candidatus Thiothrix sp. Deng01]
MQLTPHQSQYFAWQLTRHAASNSLESLAPTLVNAQIDLNPHQVEAALFAYENPLSKGVILADEVGLGKTIEAGLVIAQRWAERKRHILIIVPANLRKQWHQELQDKFGLSCLLLESKNYNALQKDGARNPFASDSIVICSYQFANSKAKDVKAVDWHLVVLDEAHRLRNVYKTGNVIARTLKDSLERVQSKILLTATPLQNSLLELYGLVSLIDERVFGDLDSFRTQFGQTNREQTLQNLRQRITPFCKRTLRRQVQQYVPYTKRIPLLEEFTPSQDEQEFSLLVSDYLRRPNLQALPEGQRQLISLVLWKLLASSPQAISGALETMANRLQSVLDDATSPDLLYTLDDDYEALDETADEWESDDQVNDKPNVREAIRQEVDELRLFREKADQIRDNSKGQALLTALERAFSELERLGAARKAIIFTESKRTQNYLQELLKSTSYGDGLVLFNGTNSDPQAQKIYKEWAQRHAGTDKVTGSKTADTRAALVDYFREQGTVMIATEAGAEGINLQFCSLVINYDLPWNPQRIEQRIGRCHRYGQRHDVVVVNFVDRTNEADRRVYELLAQKFQLFDGVFGASDEVLGAIGSGIDFERRIAQIYQQDCRDPNVIRHSFETLQQELAGEISAAMQQTRQVLLETFDETVNARLRQHAEDSKVILDRYERMLMDLSRTALRDHADFGAENHFELLSLPTPALTNQAPLGRYELPRRTGESHLYRLGHPLAEWVLEQAKQIHLPAASLRFDYAAYAGRITTLESYQGKRGSLQAKLVTVSALAEAEQHILVAAVDQHGRTLPEDDPDKLLRIPATVTATAIDIPDNPKLQQDLAQRKNNLLRQINERNLSYFDQEVQKLDAWADDLKLGLEQEIKDIDREIKEVRRTAAVAPTLDEKLHWQKRQRELETKRSKSRRELFRRQDDIDDQRNDLITGLENRLQQRVEEQTLFTIEWELV